MTTLVTILGRARRRDGEEGYEKTTYRFPDGAEYPTPYFGLALAQHLRPSEVVILGTKGSLWSVLVEDLADAAGADEEARIELMDAEQSNAVEQSLLDRLAPLMQRAVKAVVRPKLISNSSEETEQYAILNAVDEAVQDSGELHFDLTHGFRHLGMVGFMSSFMLQRIRRLDVIGLWYGALDMKGPDGAAPVVRLDGLMRVRRWLDALDRFDATGDYGVFAPLLEEDGVPADKAQCLKDAAFLERTLNVPDAARKLRTFLPSLDKPLAGASGLFQHRLKERLRWATATPLSEQRRKLAHQYLKRRDFVRAAMFGWEACVSRVCEQRGISMSDFGEEQQAVRDFEREADHATRRGIQSLRALRNALAHGEPPPKWQANAQAALKDPQKLAKELETTMQRIFG